MEHRQSPYASEVILYRTRTDILTDQRIIANGAMTPLHTVSAAKVTPMWYYVPLQVARLLALPVIVVLLLGIIGIGGDPSTFVRAGYLVLLLVVGGFVVLAPHLMPTHTILLKTAAGSVRFLYSHDPGHLQTVVSEINDAIAQITQVDQQ